MPSIRPSSDLRNKYNEVSEFCHQHQEPVYITKNGSGDLVVLSVDTYERLVGKFELCAMLEKSLGEVERCEGRPMDEVFDDLERRLTGDGL